jgi:hypothetical protein
MCPVLTSPISMSILQEILAEHWFCSIAIGGPVRFLQCPDGREAHSPVKCLVSKACLVVVSDKYCVRE